MSVNLGVFIKALHNAKTAFPFSIFEGLAGGLAVIIVKQSDKLLFYCFDENEQLEKIKLVPTEREKSRRALRVHKMRDISMRYLKEATINA